MAVVAHTGAHVAPGDILYTSTVTDGPSPRGKGAEDVAQDNEVVPGEGCLVHYMETSSTTTSGNGVARCIAATRHGVAQWDGRLVSVFPSVAAGATRSAVRGPRPGDVVHLRTTRLNRLFAFGEIMAVNGQWCSHRSQVGAAVGGVFKGVLRQEDIRPFRPTKDQLQPPAPSLAFAAGDVVLAEVISQSDAHQYQLSTVGEAYGVVEGYACAAVGDQGGESRVRLQHISGRRDAMMVPGTGEVVPRWCPLLP